MGLPGQAIHQLIREQAGMDEQEHKKQPDALLPGTLTINLPGPLQEALSKISTLLPTVPDKTKASLRLWILHHQRLEFTMTSSFLAVDPEKLSGLTVLDIPV